MKALTVAIASFQRREAVTRLVASLESLAEESPASWLGVDVLVVLDGSTDGSREALADLETSFPLTVLWQENAGLSAARNAGLRAATGEIIWFLDDDLVPLAGTIDLHREAHERSELSMLIGPCDVAPTISLSEDSEQYWEHLSVLRAESESITRFDLIAVANSSVPTQLMRSVGGLDEEFVGYGLEDYELGLRLLEAGTSVRFDRQAACWHYSSIDPELARLRRREEGRNTVRFLRMHPEIAETYLPSSYPGRSMLILDRLGIRAPTALAAISSGSASIIHLLSPLLARSKRGQFIRTLPYDASYAAGVADLDRSLVPRVLGRPT